MIVWLVLVDDIDDRLSFIVLYFCFAEIGGDATECVEIFLVVVSFRRPAAYNGKSTPVLYNFVNIRERRFEAGQGKGFGSEVLRCVPCISGRIDRFLDVVYCAGRKLDYPLTFAVETIAYPNIGFFDWLLRGAVHIE